MGEACVGSALSGDQRPEGGMVETLLAALEGDASDLAMPLRALLGLVGGPERGSAIGTQMRAMPEVYEWGFLSAEASPIRAVSSLLVLVAGVEGGESWMDAGLAVRRLVEFCATGTDAARRDLVAYLSRAIAAKADPSSDLRCSMALGVALLEGIGLQRSLQAALDGVERVLAERVAPLKCDDLAGWRHTMAMVWGGPSGVEASVRRLGKTLRGLT